MRKGKSLNLIDAAHRDNLHASGSNYSSCQTRPWQTMAVLIMPPLDLLCVFPLSPPPPQNLTVEDSFGGPGGAPAEPRGLSAPRGSKRKAPYHHFKHAALLPLHYAQLQPDPGQADASAKPCSSAIMHHCRIDLALPASVVALLTSSPPSFPFVLPLLRPLGSRTASPCRRGSRDGGYPGAYPCSQRSDQHLWEAISEEWCDIRLLFLSSYVRLWLTVC